MMGRHLGIDFSWIFVDFGSQVGAKLGSKIDKKSNQQKALKNKRDMKNLLIRELLNDVPGVNKQPLKSIDFICFHTFSSF